jgi:hypothetical protein
VINEKVDLDQFREDLEWGRQLLEILTNAEKTPAEKIALPSIEAPVKSARRVSLKTVKKTQSADLSSAEAAELLNVSVGALAALDRKGILKPSKRGVGRRGHVYLRSDVIAFAEKRREK